MIHRSGKCTGLTLVTINTREISRWAFIVPWIAVVQVHASWESTALKYVKEERYKTAQLSRSSNLKPNVSYQVTFRQYKICTSMSERWIWECHRSFSKTTICAVANAQIRIFYFGCTTANPDHTFITWLNFATTESNEYTSMTWDQHYSSADLSFQPPRVDNISTLLECCRWTNLNSGVSAGKE